MSRRERLEPRMKAWPSVALAAMMGITIVATTLWAPTEQNMGHAQRILYVHVPVAWFGLLAFVVMAMCGIAFLRSQDLYWDAWAVAAAELGWLCSTLTLITGSLWARAAWGTWWTWDPRLTTSFVLWMLYSGCLLVRGSQAERTRAARLGAVLAVLGLVDVPMVIMATRWFRGMHPVAPEMEPAMRWVLLTSTLGHGMFFATLLMLRSRQVRQENLLAESLSHASTPC